MQSLKRTILVDLDGVLNSYQGQFDKDFIPEPLENTKEFLEKLSKNFTIKLFTTRNRLLTSKWLINNGLDNFIEDITNVKDIAWLIIDDRCINFDGNYENLMNKIENFKPWYK